MLRIESHGQTTDFWNIRWISSEYVALAKLIYWNEGEESIHEIFSELGDGVEFQPNLLNNLFMKTRIAFNNYEIWHHYGHGFTLDEVTEIDDEFLDDPKTIRTSAQDFITPEVVWNEHHECDRKNVIYDVHVKDGLASVYIYLNTDIETLRDRLKSANLPGFDPESFDQEPAFWGLSLSECFDSIKDLVMEVEFNQQIEREIDNYGFGAFLGCKDCEPTEDNLNSNDFFFGQDSYDSEEAKELIFAAVTEFLNAKSSKVEIAGTLQKEFASAVEDIDDQSVLDDLKTEISELLAASKTELPLIREWLLSN